MYLLNMLEIYTDNISIFNYLSYYFREVVANLELHQKIVIYGTATYYKHIDWQITWQCYSPYLP